VLANDRPALLGTRFDRAIVYALDAHRRQVRKESGVPYAAHLLGVCAIALEFGANETEAIAALLHDAVEDQGGRRRLRDIEDVFGPEVAAIVEGCTDSFETDEDAQKAPWYDRKRTYIDGLAAHSGDAILLVSASDKLYNALATLNDLQRAGDSVFGRFKSGTFGTLWYYSALADAYTSRPGRQNPVGLRLRATVDALAGEHITQPELLAKFAADPTVDGREKGSAGRLAGA
jgi:GTP pyrophosphokinase